MEGSSHFRRSDQLRETIEERIVTGRYLPGMRLDEVELATEFEVSRTPIREALMQLAYSRLIEMRPRRGAIVAGVTPERLCEMFEVMAELEALCGRNASRRMNKFDKQTLLAAHKSCEKAHDSNNPDEYYRRNETFHLAIYNASHNSFLIEEAVAVQRRLSPYRRLQVRVRDRMKTSFVEHTAIVEAIVSGEGELAAELLRKHIIVQGERFADLIASLSGFGSTGSFR
jgi:DNA-binding GntR family transcriptional regulator